MELGLVNLTRS